MNYENSKAHPALIIVAIVGGLAFSTLRYSFSTPPDDFWFQSRAIENPKPVIVKFGAEWCGPCRAISPELDRLKQRYSGQLDVVQIDIEEKRHLARHYGVQGIPRIFLFDKGRIKKSRTGFASQEELLAWSQPYFH